MVQADVLDTVQCRMNISAAEFSIFAQSPDKTISDSLIDQTVKTLDKIYVDMVYEIPCEFSVNVHTIENHMKALDMIGGTASMKDKLLYSFANSILFQLGET